MELIRAMNATKVIVARAIVTKESRLSHNVISGKFQYNKHFTMNTFLSQSVRYTEVLWITLLVFQ